MAHSFSLAHLTALGWSPPELIYNAHLLGYDMAGIRSISMGVQRESDFDLSRNKKLFDLTRQALQETGLALHDIELAKIDDRSEVRDYQKHLETGAELGARVVISSIWTDRRDFYLEQFATLCDLAAGCGLRVVLEFPSWAAVWNLRGAREVLEAVRRPNAEILLDTLHVHRSGVTLEEIKDCPAGWFRMAHVCDGPVPAPDRSDTASLIHTGRDERYYVGEGGIDIAGIVGCLSEDAVLAVELPHVERSENLGFTEHARRCLVTTQDYCKRHGIH